MGTVMPIITGVLEGRVGFLIIALAVVMVVLISLIIIQRINLKKRKAEISQKVLLDTLFPDENLRKSIARNLQIEVTDPVSYKALETIVDLQAEYAKITDITGISHLPNLSILSLTNNELTQLPEEISELKHLTELKLAYNELVTVSPIYKSQTLQMLDVSGNKLTQLPDEIFMLPELTKIIAINCDLEELPEAVGQATKLKEINIGHNALKSLPESIGNLVALEKLIVNNNELVTVPASLAKIASLTELTLAANLLENIPEAVQALMKSKEIPVPKLETELADEEASNVNAREIEKELDQNEENKEALAQVDSLDKMEEVSLGTKVNTFIDLTSSNDNLLAELEALEKGKEFFAEKTEPMVELNKEVREEPLKVKIEEKTLIDELGALDNEPVVELQEVTVAPHENKMKNPIEKFKNMNDEEKAKVKKIAKITGGIAAVGAVVLGGTYLILAGDKKKGSPFNKKRKGFFER